MKCHQRCLVVVDVQCPVQSVSVVIFYIVIQTVIAPYPALDASMNVSSLPLVCGQYDHGLISPMSSVSNSSSNVVGVQVPDDFLRLPAPTKQEPLSDRMVAGTPNLPTDCWRTATVFSDVASLHSAVPVTQREVSSRWVIRRSPLMRVSSMECQSVCHIVWSRGAHTQPTFAVWILPEIV